LPKFLSGINNNLNSGLDESSDFLVLASTEIPGFFGWQISRKPSV
jgi:hypothetical protein